MDSSEFRALMATFPSGVTVVTADDVNRKPWGMTCSSVCSVTVEPPTLLICLRNESPTLAAILRTSGFALNLLHDRGSAVAELFSSGNDERFDRVRWESDGRTAGPHLVDAAHAVADCRVSMTLPVRDHVVVFGEVFRVRTFADATPAPLLYGLRSYARWPDERIAPGA
ncbi:flavin reductase [Nocardia gamkensis]|uniref:Flavin reductase n=1 Tax=Nocardia gamkensis TaxID=352869 RepID=A0A7X6KZH7_9NOCA|nr:flavin reductase [Nocardia gamkensis]